MSTTSRSGKALRILAIILFGFASVVMLLGGIGTSCAAWAPQAFGSMAVLAQMQWLYITVSILTTALGVWGIYLTVALARGKGGSYRSALIMLLIGLVAAGAQMLASEALRGKSAPNNMRVYITLFTLVVLLLLRLPAVWKRMGFESGGGSGSAMAPTGAAMLVMGLVMLSVQYWAAAGHWIDGVNYADVWHTRMLIAGGLTTACGLALLVLRGVGREAITDRFLAASN